MAHGGSKHKNNNNPYTARDGARMIQTRQRIAYKDHPEKGAVESHSWTGQITAAQESLSREIDANAYAA
jgi:hypothetical protein